MDNTFDLVVVGTGAAASTIANRCRAAGWSVAIIDELPYAGTCQLRGCDPKKVLRRGAEVVDAVRLLHGKGVADPGLRIDWPSLMRFKRSFTDLVPANKEKAFADSGIATYNGTARFVADDAIEVGGERLQARHVVIAPVWQVRARLMTARTVGPALTSCTQVRDNCHEIQGDATLKVLVSMRRKSTRDPEMESYTLLIKEIECWNCSTKMKIAFVTDGQAMYEPAEFGPRIVAMALDVGVKLEFRESAMWDGSYRANVCPSCDRITGRMFLHRYFYDDDVAVIPLPDFDIQTDLTREDD